MTAAQWERAKEVTADALELAPEARDQFVAAACGDDFLVQHEVLRLLAGAASEEPNFLSLPPLRLPDLLERHIQHTFATGQTVASRFRIDRFISSGGMGEVYAALDLELQEMVALKTIRPLIASSGAAVENFKREVSQSRRINHPNVCRVYDLFSQTAESGEQIWFLTMELLEGTTLADCLKDGPLARERARAITLDLVSAIAAAHKIGIVHRDLKPSNVIIVKGADGNERAVVTDFGLSIELTSHSVQEHGNAGTPAYMSPEQLSRGPIVLATDQFALGLMICGMLGGPLPNLDRTSRRRLEMELGAWLKGPDGRSLDRVMKRVVQRCLQFDPKDRFDRVERIDSVIDARRRFGFRFAAGAIAAVLTVTGVFFSAFFGDERVVDSYPLTSEAGMASSPAISANGEAVVYASDRGEAGNEDIWIQQLSGGDAKRLTSNPAVETDPAISPDGRLVAFRSERDGGGIYLVNANGTGERPLAKGGRSPVFSPDGHWVIFWTGTRDDAAGSGEIYKMAVPDGVPFRMAESFADARFPIWSPDGKYILFEGCEKPSSALGTCSDWWIMHADGTNPINSGALTAVKHQQLHVQTPPVKSWWRDRLIFSAASGSAMALWAIRISESSHHATGQAWRITQGDARERDPSTTAAGRIAFGRSTGALHIWRLEVSQRKDTETRQMTNDAGLDGCPSISRNGRWLYLSRKGVGSRGLFLIDLFTGQESRLSHSGDDYFWPVASASGDRAAVETRSASREAIWIIDRNGQAKRLCTGCSHPTSWFGGEAVLYTTAKGEIAQLTPGETQARVILSAPAGRALGGADWSPDQEYMLFTDTAHGGAKQTYTIQYPKDARSPRGRWAPVTSDGVEMEQPHWSGDGKAIYFLSKRDGNNCVWGVRFDSEKGQVEGKPFSIRHYHDHRFSPDRASPVARGLAVSGQSIFVNIGEVTDTVWVGRISGLLDRWRSALPFLR